MRRVLRLHPGPIHEKFIYFKRSVLDLLISLLSISQNRSGLRIVITRNPFEIAFGVLVTLMHNGNFIDQSRSIRKFLLEMTQISVNVNNTLTLQKLNVEHPLDVDVTAHLRKSLE